MPKKKTPDELKALREQAINRSYLANHLKKLCYQNGWWYRLPRIKKDNPDKASKRTLRDPDDVLPHFGILLGLPEAATVEVLKEMGFCNIVNGAPHWISSVWDEMKSTYKLQGVFELGKTAINGIRSTYVRVGRTHLNPTKIYEMYQNPKRRTELRVPTTWMGLTRMHKAFFQKIVKKKSLVDSLLSDGLTNYVRKAKKSSTEDDKEDDNKEDDNNDDNKDDDNGEEKNQEEESQTNNQPMNYVASTSSSWFLKEGQVASANEYPVLAEFGIPVDNDQTVQLLLGELAHLQQSRSSAPLRGSLKKNAILLPKGQLFVRFAKGDSAATCRRLAKNVCDTIEQWCTSDCSNKHTAEIRIRTHLLNKIDATDPDTFLDVATDRGYATQRSPKMSAEYWNAMVEESNLRKTQQQTVKAYINHHFGRRIVDTDRAIAQVGCEFVPYISSEKIIEGEKISYHHRSAIELFRQYSHNILVDAQHISNVELLFGGDHGKGAFTFMFVVIVRYSNNLQRQPGVFEFQLGQIDSVKDSEELLKPLMLDMEEGVLEMKPNNEGKSVLCVGRGEDGYTNKVNFVQIGQQVPDTTIYKIPTSFLLMGDLKFLFMVMGRPGFSGHHCLFCKQTKAQWVAAHNAKQSIYCDADQWTNEDLIQQAINPDLASVKYAPLWSYLPINHIVPPLLHITLGLVNDLLDHFFKWVDETVEPLTVQEHEARILSLLAELVVDEWEESLENFEEVLREKIELRKDINKRLKQRGLERNQKEELQKQKEIIKLNEKEARDNRNNAQKVLEKYKQQASDALNNERQVRSQRGKKDKPLREEIIHLLWTVHNISMSSYHGGDMEGPSCRRLTGDGERIFDNIAECIKNSNKKLLESGDEQISKKIVVGDDEIERRCQAYGRALLLLDSSMSKLNTPRGKVTDEVIEKLEQTLKALMMEWSVLTLSFTPKFHMLLNHCVEALKRMNGFSDMGEDRCERAHQDRVRNQARLIRMRNKQQVMMSQAKMQGLKHVFALQEIQQAVATGRRRKRKGEELLSKLRADEKRFRREETRDEAYAAHLIADEMGELTQQFGNTRELLKGKLLEED